MNQVVELRLELAKQLKEVLRTKSWTQAQAATRLGTTQPRISNVLNGNVEAIGAEQLVEWLAVLDHVVQVKVAERDDTPAADERARLLEQARQSYESGQIWGPLGLAKNLLWVSPRFHAAGALIYRIMSEQGWDIDARAYQKYAEPEGQ